MTSVRGRLNVVGKTASIQQLARKREALFPLSLRQFVGAPPADSPIKHVFVLMLENRSFDHMLGFSGITGTDAATGLPTRIDGLTGNESNSFGGRTIKVSRDAPDVWDQDPAHSFEAVLEQLCGEGAVYPSGGAYPAINNSGYVSSYAKRVKTTDPEVAGRVMRCYGPDQLPVLNALAREFVVCDRWFCSMPGATEPNRMFMHAESSGDFDEAPSNAEIILSVTLPFGGYEFRHGTGFKLLEKAGVEYRIYAGDRFPFASELDGISVLFDIREFEDLADDLRDPSFDAGYIHIEPFYDIPDFAGGNSQHPIGSIAAGERLIKATYETIRNSPVWEKSILIITYDEHGGYYDHAIPGAAPGTGERGREHGFTFEQLGPRVPAIIVSPLIPRNLIEHRPFDHTDIPATLRRLFGLPALTARDGLSGGVARLATLQTARTDAPRVLPGLPIAGVAPLLPPQPAFKAAPRQPEKLISDDPHGNVLAMLHSAVVQHLQVTPPEQHAAIRARVAQLKTHADLFPYLREVEQLVREKRVQKGVDRAQPDVPKV